jgi:acyl-CoA synthetase (NDP forming)
MSNAGFEAVAVADALGPLRLAGLSAGTGARLEALLRERRLDPIVTLANPLDVNPMMDDAGFLAAAEALLDDPGVDTGLIGCVPLTGALQTLPASDTHREDLASGGSVVSGLCDLWERTRLAWVAVVDAGEIYDPMARHLDDHGIPVFRTADRAVRLLGTYAEWRVRAAGGGREAPRSG